MLCFYHVIIINACVKVNSFISRIKLVFCYVFPAKPYTARRNVPMHAKQNESCDFTAREALDIRKDIAKIEKHGTDKLVFVSIAYFFFA